MVIYGYKPDTFIAVYPALQRTDAPRCNIFKNTAVYLTDWLTQMAIIIWTFTLVGQQFQVVPHAEFVNFTEAEY